MADAHAIPDSDVQIAITLACLTYLSEDKTPSEIRQDIESHLEQPDLPTANAWRVVWGPAVNRPNMWYIARGPNSLGRSSLALVIRGTNLGDSWGLLQDLDLKLVPVPFADERTPPEARIAQGFAEAFDNLSRATDEQGQTAFDFLADALEPGTVLDVVGHSLGGTMTPIVALAVKQAFASTKVRPFAFAGMSPGNLAFAKLYVSSFPGQPSRWINDIDIISMFYGGMDEMLKLFPPPGPVCPGYVAYLVSLVTNRGEYAQAPFEYRYHGVQYSMRKSDLFQWERQASYQHQHLYFMFLSGIPTDVIRRRLGPDWLPPPGPIV
jgi:hypothetical protein